MPRMMRDDVDVDDDHDVEEQNDSIQRFELDSTSSNVPNIVVEPYKYHHFVDLHDDDEEDAAPLLQLHHNNNKSHVSLQDLNPTAECHTRKSTAATAMFNLVATVSGGGVLSLPLAFSRAGIVPTTLLMLYAAVITDLSLVLLVDCARWTGGRTYGDVAQAAFGSAAQVVTTLTLTTMLCGSLIAYQVLVRDVWTPVLLSLFPCLRQWLLMLGALSHDDYNDGATTAAATTAASSSTEAGNLLLGCILIAALPLLLKRDLHALRFACYIGFGSCVLLMAAVVFRAVETPSVTWETVNWYSTDMSDWLFAFPIVVLCFFGSFNVLSIHSSLVRPTRRRVRMVLDSSMLICFVLFYAVGLCGYLYAGNATRDNILLNFKLSDPAVMAGRVGFCLTLMFGLPLILLPCRDAAICIPQHFRMMMCRYDDHLLVVDERFNNVRNLQKESGAHHLVSNGVDFDEQVPIVVSSDPKNLHGTMLKYGTGLMTPRAPSPDTDGTVSTADESQDSSVAKAADSHDAISDSWQDALVHVGSTVSILAMTFAAAASVPGVETIVSIFGSSMAIWIAFIVPTACYIKIRQHKGLTVLALSAWLLLVASCISAVVCTRQAIANAL